MANFTHSDRRRFLRAGVLIAAGAVLEGAGLGLLSGQARGARGVKRLLRKGGLVLLPARGTLLVASDFHARFGDFSRWLERTDLVAKLSKGEDVYGLIVGDMVDRKGSDPEADPDGDTRILRRIMEIQKSLPAKARNRFVCIRGNHERAVINIYEKLIKDGATPRNWQDRIKALYDSSRGGYYRQFNFIERVTDELYRYIKGLPIAVWGCSGVVGVHGGPSRSMASTKDLISEKKDVYKEIVWSRPAEIKDKGHTAKELAGFLEKFDRAGLLVTGHTPISSLPKEYRKKGVGFYGGHQIILATSYGSTGGRKSYLELDLSKAYPDANALREGKEILPLQRG